MAYESSEEPGRKFQNIQHGKTFDRVRKEEKSAKKAKPAKHDEPDGDEQDIHEVVSEHGPAHKTEIEKADGEESYSVHSHHEDGHKHSSHGHSLHEAHQHSMIAHGEPGGMEEEQPAEEAEAMPMASGAGAAPPGM